MPKFPMPQLIILIRYSSYKPQMRTFNKITCSKNKQCKCLLKMNNTPHAVTQHHRAFRKKNIVRPRPRLTLQGSCRDIPTLILQDKS